MKLRSKDVFIDSKLKDQIDLAEFRKRYSIRVLDEFDLKERLSAIEISFQATPQQALFAQLLDDLPNLVIASVTELDNLSRKYSIFTDNQIKDIEVAFSYAAFRHSIHGLWFAKTLGIKTCVYCNTAYTLVADGARPSDAVALFEFDHFYPKSLYPWLSLSMHNLIPSCGSCNRILSDDLKPTHLSATPLDKLFNVQIKNFSEEKYLLTPKEIKFIEIEAKSVEPDSDYDRLIFKKLRIAERYVHFSDIAQEMVWKKQVYTEAYKTQVAGLLGPSVTPETINRILWGNYCTPDDYHKRPLSKFTTDICRQLKVL